jgi:hypothetical protein
MITYHSEGFRPIRHDDEHGIDGPRAAAAAFAARIAHREFGQRGHCRTIRLDSSSRDGMHGHYEAFIGAPTYLVFFELAGGNAQRLMTELGSTLAAISMGAVYMGAMTMSGTRQTLWFMLSQPSAACPCRVFSATALVVRIPAVAARSAQLRRGRATLTKPASSPCATFFCIFKCALAALSKYRASSLSLSSSRPSKHWPRRTKYA